MGEEESYLIEQIEAIKREYERAVKPYTERLAKIRESDPVYIRVEQASAMLEFQQSLTEHQKQQIAAHCEPITRQQLEFLESRKSD